MYYVADSNKSFSEAVTALEKAVPNNAFGILHVHDLATILKSKGMEFEEECKVFEVCNPNHASVVMAIDMQLNMALPCRISVYTEEGQVKIGCVKPVELLRSLSDDPVIAEVAQEVEEAMIAIIDQAA